MASLLPVGRGVNGAQNTAQRRAPAARSKRNGRGSDSRIRAYLLASAPARQCADAGHAGGHQTPSARFRHSANGARIKVGVFGGVTEDGRLRGQAGARPEEAAVHVQYGKLDELQPAPHRALSDKGMVWSRVPVPLKPEYSATQTTALPLSACSEE